ncbi:hypothetical protein [Synechococcus sp. PCC 6312]|uniref:hypothetical protein n=1 Tax=Synechococcus sp. (strain ATCC 27167 / PCC 6312) TaxID=195253 RepID=UPI00029F3ABF|nr:hypothetical protein [Synechococcus sp. PCC 6312]AFY60331.1 hypothetical protein Syn6312_1142 [Synechococcus sp. PCC 6312]
MSNLKPQKETFEQLSLIERSDLERLEQTIRAGLNTFVEVGQALQKIREQRLYRETHQTFEAYCEDKFDLRRNYADKTIAASSFVERISTIGVILPTNESQVREILTLPEDRQVEAWREVAEAAASEGKLTADLVKTVVKRLREVRLPGGNDPQSPDVASGPRVAGPEVPLSLLEAGQLVLTGVGEEMLHFRDLSEAQDLAGRPLYPQWIGFGPSCLLRELLPLFRDGLFCLYFGWLAVYVGDSPIEFYEAFVGLGDIWARQEVGDE